MLGSKYTFLFVLQENIGTVLNKENIETTDVVIANYPVAKHICALDIDARLKAVDVTKVGDIQHVTTGDIEKNFCLKVL